VCLVLSCLRGVRVNSLKARPLCQSRLQKIAFHASCADSPFSIVQCRSCQLSNAAIGVVVAADRSVLPRHAQVATILLGSMLCYDVFWVFIQPRLSNSSSVMVEVCYLLRMERCTHQALLACTLLSFCHAALDTWGAMQHPAA